MKGPERHGPAVAALSCLDYSLCPRRNRAYLAEIYLLESSAREKAAILFRAPEQGSAKSSDIEIALFHFGSTIRAFHRDLLLRRSNYATNAFTFVLKESVLAPQFTPGQLLNSQPVGFLQLSDLCLVDQSRRQEPINKSKIIGVVRAVRLLIDLKNNAASRARPF